MFAHVVRGKVTGAGDGARRFDLWKSEPGWASLTGGVTAAAELIAVALFPSPADVPRGWGQGLDEFSVFGTGDVAQSGDGVAPEAGFVQMMLARVADRATLERIEAELEEGFRRWRPDFLGGYRIWLPDGRVLALDYFSSEADARAGENSEPPPEVAEKFPQWLAQLSDTEWFDLPDPWVATA
ncbi:MAG: hypothetical protein ACLGI2_14280 [Acidimicrobiia bacterium]